MTRVLVTGAAGYVGTTLIHGLMASEDIESIVGVDLKSPPSSAPLSNRVKWVNCDVSSSSWHSVLEDEAIDVIIHLAFVIKPAYGAREAAQSKENSRAASSAMSAILGSTTTRRLIHFSTVSAYGALPTNSAEKPILEGNRLQEHEYVYGRDKARIESELVKDMTDGGAGKELVILRCASITGPRGREAKRYGLLSTLTGFLPIIPCGGRGFGRNYLHEEDLVRAIGLVIRAPIREGVRIYNLSAPGYVDVSAMGASLGKKVLFLPGWLVRGLFGVCWHTFRGRVPTPPGAWRYLTYPIATSGEQFTRSFPFAYQYSSLSTLREVQGLAEV